MMNKKLYRPRLLALAVTTVVGGVISPVLIAQDGALEEVIVTAEKREADLQKTSVSMQVVTGSQLNAEGKKRIDDIMKGVVGVASQGTQVGTTFFMRGMGPNTSQPIGGVDESPVAVLIDGVYQNRGETVRGGTLDVSQAEIMRGTQSTTLGASSLAGAVSLVSNDPIFDYEGSASLEMGNYNLVSMEGVINTPLTENQALRFAYSKTERDGYISSGAGDSDLTNTRVKYRVLPNDDLDIVLTASQNVIGGNGIDNSVLTYDGYWEAFDESKVSVDDGGSCTSNCYDAQMSTLYGHLSSDESYEDRSDPWDDGYPANAWPNYPYRHTTINQFSADIDWQLDFGTLTIKPSYQHADYESDETPRGTSWRGEDRVQETTQLDVQLTSNPDSVLEWLGGVYYYDTSFSGDFRTTALPGNGAGPDCPSVSDTQNTYCWSYSDTGTETYSVYANTSYPVTDALRVLAGFRYSEDEKHMLKKFDAPGDIDGVSDAGFSTVAEGDASWDEVTYRVGVEYDLTEESMAYATLATGYQPGRVYDDQGTQSIGSTKAETLQQITLGYKSRWFDNRVQFNAEYFHSVYHDRALDGSVSVYDGDLDVEDLTSPCASSSYGYATDGTDYYACYSVNSPTVPDLYSEGIDLELSWYISDYDRLDISAEWLDSTTTTPDGVPTESEFLSLLSSASDGAYDASDLYDQLVAIAESYDGLVLANSPEYSANVTYAHTFPFANGSELTAKINMEYKDWYWSMSGTPGIDMQDLGDSVQDAYEIFNVYLNWVSADSRWSVNGYVKNIENEAIQTDLRPSYNGDPAYVTLAAPRTYGASVSLNF